MTTRRRRFVRVSAVVAATALTASGLSGVSNATGAGIWNCSPGNGFTYACTTITSAPASGVQVLDRDFNVVVTLHNGDNVAIDSWGKDTSGLCGVGGDPYV
ncbi:hypothetical protein [Actinomadura sp. NTSP31]|uniref:hypothetical protein n=1 Tax=Actinomadura sp. NTSP31 TaxID=1735447 RepID=UPI0035C0D7A0